MFGYLKNAVLICCWNGCRFLSVKFTYTISSYLLLSNLYPVKFSNLISPSHEEKPAYYNWQDTFLHLRISFPANLVAQARKISPRRAKNFVQIFSFREILTTERQSDKRNFLLKKTKLVLNSLTVLYVNFD